MVGSNAMYIADTIVAAATPPGKGAVAIIRLSGPRALAIAHALWHPLSPSGLRARELRLGEIRDPIGETLIDRAMCVTMPAPHSLTGEDVAELHCHGGVYLVRRVLALALDLGARMAEPGEFSRRAYLNGRLGLTEAEAIADLVAARSESALRQALRQMHGALAVRVDRMREQVIAIRAHLEAAIDFSDEDLKLPSGNEIADQIGRLLEDLAPLHDSFVRGRLNREGARAAIIGKPNAGKSSILNLLLGAERAIVTPIAGTTRDVIEDSVNLGPYTLVLLDTAGMRESTDQIERLGIERARESSRAADLLIAVFDSSRPFETDDAEVIGLCRGRPGLALLNKCDLAPRLDARELRALGLDLPLMGFCAIDSSGIGALRDRLAAMLDELAGPSGGEEIAISRERHRAALAAASAALERARAAARGGLPPELVAVDVMIASNALGAITGAVGTEDILDAVFREFCIGK
ncbi:MAG: tRNA uridine-5-carboxymethylaminomethyl(34) synthesis GTPase MnmE [Candidatus Binataceae bacterium]